MYSRKEGLFNLKTLKVLSIYIISINSLLFSFGNLRPRIDNIRDKNLNTVFGTFSALPVFQFVFIQPSLWGILMCIAWIERPDWGALLLDCLNSSLEELSGGIWIWIWMIVKADVTSSVMAMPSRKNFVGSIVQKKKAKAIIKIKQPVFIEIQKQGMSHNMRWMNMTKIPNFYAILCAT